MRTTLDINDALMSALLDRLPGVSKTEAIERALRAFLADDATTRLRGLAGSLEIDDLSTTLRSHDRSS
jgi:hypothetical protein